MLKHPRTFWFLYYRQEPTRTYHEMTFVTTKDPRLASQLLTRKLETYQVPLKVVLPRGAIVVDYGEVVSNKVVLLRVDAQIP